MAIVYKEGNEDGWLVLWRITEDVSELARLATSAEIVQAKRIRNDARRREWLAWRAALREMIPEAQVAYRKNGAPILVPPKPETVDRSAADGAGTGVASAGTGVSGTETGTMGARAGAVGTRTAAGSAGYIGVSHTGDLVAIVYSRHAPCAVDIEQLNRDFRRAEPRYLSDTERRLTGHGKTWFPALMWCAKETLYKLAGVSGVDFRDEIRITSVDPTSDATDPETIAGRLTGRVRGGTEVSATYFTFGDHLVVHAR